MHTLSDEEEARRVIAGIVADWDAAYSARNARGVLGHHVPEDRPREEQNYQSWQTLMDWTGKANARSTVRQFQLNGSQATTTVEQCRSFSFRGPLPTDALLSRKVMGWVSRLVFVEREVSRLNWLKTGEGWLCHAEKQLSYRMHVRLRAGA